MHEWMRASIPENSFHFQGHSLVYQSCLPIHYFPALSISVFYQSSFPLPTNQPFPVPTNLSLPLPTHLSFTLPTNLSFPLPTNISFPLPTSIFFLLCLPIYHCHKRTSALTCRLFSTHTFGNKIHLSSWHLTAPLSPSCRCPTGNMLYTVLHFPTACCKIKSTVMV